MARFLPLLKKRRKKNTGTAEAVNSIADTKQKNNLTQELRYSKIAKVIDDRKALEEEE
jgi:hypothetical protein